jgi:hypothetical protein
MQATIGVASFARIPRVSSCGITVPCFRSYGLAAR